MRKIYLHSFQNKVKKLSLHTNLSIEMYITRLILQQLATAKYLFLHYYPLTSKTIYHIVRLTIWNHLFLEFWLVRTWFCARWCHQRAVTRLENVRQLNIRWGKKLGFQLSHRQPLIYEHTLNLCLKYKWETTYNPMSKKIL